MLREAVLSGRFDVPRYLQNESPFFLQLLSGMSVSDFRKMYPHTDPGEDEKSPHHGDFIDLLDSRSLPPNLSHDYVNSALYAEQDSFEGLERFFMEKIQTMGEFYQYDESTNKDELRPIDVQKILTIKRAMADYLHGQTRRTGEPSMAHLYRVTLRVMDTFRALRNTYSSGGPVSKVFTHHVETAIIGALIHDHIEDEYQITADGKILRGGFQYKDGQPRTKEGGITLYQYWQDPNNIKRDKDGNEVIDDSAIIPRSKVTIPLGSYQYSTLKETIRALNTNDGSKESMGLRLKHGMAEIETNLRTDIYSIIMPLIIKFCDRQDNLATYFRFENGRYISARPEKLFAKLNETLAVFAEMETTMEQAIRIMRWRRAYPADVLVEAIPQLNLKAIAHPLIEATTSHPLRNIFPTIPARLLLLGYTHDEIYHLPRFGAGLPKIL